VEIDFSLLFYVWVFGWGCGALSWYWVLTFYDSNDQSNNTNKEGK